MTRQLINFLARVGILLLTIVGTMLLYGAMSYTKTPGVRFSEEGL